MSYLYGDSTPSKLEMNFIELLRDAVECCVQVLLADQRIAEGAARTRALDASTTAEIAALQKLGALVPKAFEGTPLGEPASATARCVAAILRSASEIVHTTGAESKATLQAAVTRRDAEAAVEREVFVKAIEALLTKHDLPGMKGDTDATLVGGTRYACRLHVATAFGLSATMELEVPAGHLLERVVRVDRLAERLEVQVPEVAGWLHKEVKLRTQHLEKHHLTAFSRTGAESELGLRLAPDGTGAGYDVTFGGPGEPVRLVRVDEQQKREEPFDAQEADAAKLTALRDKVAAAVAELGRHRTRIVEARLENEPLQGHAKPSLLVERIIAVLVPETREISFRSQSPGELVLRRSLGGDRREEIFLSKKDLKTKIEPLNDRNRALFEALLEGGPLTVETPPAPSPKIEPPPAPSPKIEPAAAGAPPDGLGSSLLRKPLMPTIVPTGQYPPPAESPPAAAHRPATPLYGVPALTPPASSGSAPHPAPTPPAGIPTGAKPALIAEAAAAAAAVNDVTPPPRKTAPVATALDRPPPAAPPPPSVSGEIGGATPDKKRTEPSGPIHTH